MCQLQNVSIVHQNSTNCVILCYNIDIFLEEVGIVMTLGQKIKFYREKQKIGQEHLAELSHISVSTIRKYESDERRPKEEQLEKIAHALHISPAALKDNKFEGIIDVLPALFGIGQFGDIQFIGDKDEDGKYIDSSVAIKFNNKELTRFLAEWADKKEEIDSVKKAVSLVKDDASREMMEARILELSMELENKIVLDKVSEHIYFEEDLPKQILSKKILKETPKLKTYDQFLYVLYSLAKVIKFECVGVWERIWEAKAIFTFEDVAVEKSNISLYAEECFAYFLFYYSEFKRLGIQTDGYAFMQGGKKYYRYIIKDRMVATAIKIINEVLSFSWDTADDFTRQRFEVSIEDKIKMFSDHIEV